MIGSLVLGALLVPLIAVQSDMPAVLRQGLKKPDGQQFWGMSKNHPMRKELERDPGVLLGRIEDFDLASLRRGDIGKLLNGHVTAKSPAYNFLRNQRSIEVRECNIPIETVVMKQGHCIRLRDNTPACKDDQYMRINYEECN